MQFLLRWKICLTFLSLVFFMAEVGHAADPVENDAEPRTDAVEEKTVKGKRPIEINHDRFTDLLEVPGKLVGSKRIVPITARNFPSPGEWARVERGADFLHHFTLGEDLQLKGVAVGRSGQVVKRRVKITSDNNEDLNVWVVLETVSVPRTVVTAVIYIADEIDQQKIPVENIRKNRWIAENAFQQAIREWEKNGSTINIGYVHYVFDKQNTVNPEEESR